MRPKTGELLDAQGVADFAGCSLEKVKGWCSSGALPAFRVGNALRVFRSDLVDFIKRSPAYADGNPVNAMQRVLRAPRSDGRANLKRKPHPSAGNVA